MNALTFGSMLPSIAFHLDHGGAKMSLSIRSFAADYAR